MTSPETEDERVAMIRALATGMPRSGLRAVTARLPDYPDPEPIDGEVPDATGQDNRLHLFVVATDDDLAGPDPDAERRWPVIAHHALAVNGTFYVAVPAGGEHAARQRLRELGLPGQIIEL